MSSFPADLARHIAQRLAAETDPDLPALTERALAEGSRAPTRSATYDPGTAIALAALLVSAAQFAWSAYRDLKKDRQEARQEPAATSPRDLLLRRLRIEMGDPPGISRARRDRLFGVVVEEVLIRPPDEQPRR